ncbi:hypothetical protein PTSG_03966 [Salpingoeca rosetta]|uniref:Cytochrome c oxidase polypeptide VIa n=1 Tax=Salpingoeca rosetta (strain ATCC 50818 / BSB-021) TaxID=946362 RepID=F2U7E1_SALR5|nr:uncharacterized protein PTSG_03966 [Salpingoeca rosetta]EGD83358.1 hypothetical protein PTSG_03966 [Salpingoeca rosetta]|eukprot:XP_004994862.1 hypothetical protein PTSG_03966 [Salpingoeca rosetta]
MQAARRLLAGGRRFASTHVAESAGKHDESSFLTYKFGSLLALPLLSYMFYKQVIAAEHIEPPPFVDYDHLRIQKKKFPWGDGRKSLFYNPHTQGTPEEHHEEHTSEEQGSLTKAMAEHLGSRGQEEIRMQHVAAVREAGAKVVRGDTMPVFTSPQVLPENPKAFHDPKRSS